MLRLFRSRFSNRNILVKVDRNLIASIIRNNPQFTQQAFQNNNHYIRINLKKLVQAASIIQATSFRPTYFQKLTEQSILLGFVANSPDFCIIKHYDADKQTRLSEDFGVGLSVVITDHFYRIDWKTLTKEPRRRGSKHDINCTSLLNEVLIIEAKGSTHKSGRSRQKKAAHRQKNNPHTLANVRIASCALLNENSISDIDFFDPPIIPPEDERYRKSIMKADHYARVFNLIGQKELSKYFNLMRKRIIHNKEFSEFELKQELFSKIKTSYIRINIGRHSYFGNVEKFNDTLFVFIGFDSELLRVSSFIDFEGYEDEYVEEGENEFHLLSDGLCIALLRNIRFIEDQINLEEIPHHFDPFSVIDFDYCRESTITEYLSYLFEKAGCEIQKQGRRILNQNFDLLVKSKDRFVAVEIKRNLDKKKIMSLLERLSEFANKENYKIIFITNRYLSSNTLQSFRSKDIEVIDRVALYEITEDHKKLLKYLE